jgi:hypothetical protein
MKNISFSAYKHYGTKFQHYLYHCLFCDGEIWVGKYAKGPKPRYFAIEYCKRCQHIRVHRCPALLAVKGELEEEKEEQEQQRHAGT